VTSRLSPLPLFRRRHDTEITLPVPTLRNLFVAPDLDPFSPEYETYGDRSGMDVIASRLKSENLKSRFRAIVELPADEVEPGVERRVEEAVGRYCRVKLAGLERDLREVTRHGIRALLLGVVAVLVLNALARPLERSGDSLLEVVAEGLQITAWVILWVPIGLLVYDRWYYSRDRKIYERILEMEIEVVAQA
jgi:hypothetical protein